LRISVVHGPDKEAAIRREADVYVVNPDGLEFFLNNWSLVKPDTLVIDESTLFKHTRTKRFKLLKDFLPKFSRRWALTGTPSPNGLLDLFGQMYILDLGRSLGAFITRYRFNYFFPTGYGGYTWALKPEADKAIQERIAPLVLRMAAKDYLEVPTVIGQLGTPGELIVRIDLPDAARKVYDELEEEMLTVLEGGETVTAVNAAVASMKCAQVANGGLYYTQEIAALTPQEQLATMVGIGPRRWMDLHTAKIEAVQEIVNELQGSPVLVAYDFEHDLARLTKAFPKFAVLGGGTSQKESTRIVDAWNAGQLEGLLGHPQAMGHGLNLQKSGNHIVWHSLTWNLELYEQFTLRVARQGAAFKNVFMHHVVARDTVDEAKLSSLRRKGRSQAALLAALKDYAKKRRRT
jgi:SNF2 family DNA or RNA helicase